MTEKIQDVLSRAVSAFVDPGGKFKEKLEKDPTSVVIKYGVDPTRPDIHLGHAVCLQKLRAFQDLGCKIVFLVGDFTSRIGDPTGKNKTRPELDQAEIEHNLKTYLDQAGKILRTDPEVFTWIRNSDWFVSIHDVAAPDGMTLTIDNGKEKMTTPPLPGKHVLARSHAWSESRMQKGRVKHYSFINILGMLRKITHSRLIERDMFQERLKGGEPIFLHEMLYPIIQGIDSAAIHDVFGACDLEIGGTDQHFNMLMGREIMEIHHQPQQAVMSLSILEGTDGTQKMGKSTGNYIGIDESPTEVFGKTLRIPDELIPRWAELCTTLDPADFAGRLESGENPKTLKVELAKELIRTYHDEEAAEKAEAEFERVHAGGNTGLPDDIPAVQVEEGSWNVIELLSTAKLVESKSEARRLIDGGAVKIDGEKVESIEQAVEVGEKEFVLQVGKRRFAKISS